MTESTYILVCSCVDQLKCRPRSESGIERTVTYIKSRAKVLVFSVRLRVKVGAVKIRQPSKIVLVIASDSVAVKNQIVFLKNSGAVPKPTILRFMVVILGAQPKAQDHKSDCHQPSYKLLCLVCGDHRPDENRLHIRERLRTAFYSRIRLIPRRWLLRVS